MNRQTLAFLYAGSVFYVLAQYGHLLLANWTIWKAMSIAIPLVCIEYLFVLNGTHGASTAGESAMNIILLVMCFNFVNIYLYGRLVLKQESDIKDLLAFILVLIASALTYKPIETSIKALGPDLAKIARVVGTM
jgi:uncharacterized protein (DUF486 family)